MSVLPLGKHDCAQDGHKDQKRRQLKRINKFGKQQFRNLLGGGHYSVRGGRPQAATPPRHCRPHDPPQPKPQRKSPESNPLRKNPPPLPPPLPQQKGSSKRNPPFAAT